MKFEIMTAKEILDKKEFASLTPQQANEIVKLIYYHCLFLADDISKVSLDVKFFEDTQEIKKSTMARAFDSLAFFKTK